MIKVLNAFSLQMLKVFPVDVRFVELSLDQAKAHVANNAVSFLGHKDIAAVASNMLGIDLPMNRESAALEKGERALVVQLVGGRLPEGAVEIPVGMGIKFILVSVK